MSLVSWYKGENNLFDSIGPTSGRFWHGAGNLYDNNGYISGVIGSGIGIDYGDIPLGTALIITNTSGTFNFQPNGIFSLSFYIKVDSTPTFLQDYWIYSKNESYPWAGSVPLFDLGIRVTNGTIKVCVGNTYTAIGGSIPNDDTWYKVLITYNVGTWKIYINDVDVSITPNIYLPVTNNYPLAEPQIGLGIPGGSFRLKFGFDEFKVYNEVIGPAVPRHITIKKDISPILINQRTSPYKLGTADVLQTKLIIKQRGHISYLKNIPTELYLNYTDSFIKYTDGITNALGIANMIFPCYNIKDISSCIGYAKVTINGIEYVSNTVRFNFVTSINLLPKLTIFPEDIILYSNDIITYED